MIHSLSKAPHPSPSFPYTGRFFVWRGAQRRRAPLHTRENTEGEALGASLSRGKPTRVSPADGERGTGLAARGAREHSEFAEERGVGGEGAPWAETLGLGWALGLALFGAVSFALYLGGVSVRIADAVALVVALGAVGVGARTLRQARRQRGAVSLSALALAVPAVQVALAAWAALRAPFASFDAWSFWLLKARMFASGGPRPGYFHDRLTLYTHPDYPLNLPLAEGALLRLPGALGLDLAALVGPACFAALLLVFYAGLTRLHGRRVAAFAVGALALVPALPLESAGGDADVPLALYLGAATLYLALWWCLRRPADAVLAGLLAGGAIWTKREGLAAAALLLAAFAVGEALRRGGSWRGRLANVGRVAAATVALPLPWLLFAGFAHPLGRDFLPYTPAVFAAHAGRLPHIAVMFALQMLLFTRWSLLWVALAAVLLLAGRRLSPLGRGLLAVLAAQLAVYALAFVFSDWRPYTAHVQTSLDRLLAQALPAALLVLVEAVRSVRPRRAPR